MNSRLLPPRLPPLQPKKSAVLSVLDIGTSKIVCLIARLNPSDLSGTLRGRTHSCRILGIGHQRSRGIKGGVVVDMDAAEAAIRLAVDAAERMAGFEVESVILNATGGRLASRLLSSCSLWRPLPDVRLAAYAVATLPFRSPRAFDYSPPSAAPSPHLSDRGRR